MPFFKIYTWRRPWTAVSVAGFGDALGTFVRQVLALAFEAHQSRDDQDGVEDAGEGSVVEYHHLQPFADELGGETGLHLGKAQYEVGAKRFDLASAAILKPAHFGFVSHGLFRARCIGADSDYAVGGAESVEDVCAFVRQTDDAAVDVAHGGLFHGRSTGAARHRKVAQAGRQCNARRGANLLNPEAWRLVEGWCREGGPMGLRIWMGVVWGLMACSSDGRGPVSIDTRDAGVGVSDGGRSASCDASCKLVKVDGGGLPVEPAVGDGSVGQGDGSMASRADASDGISTVQPRPVRWARRLGGVGIEGAQSVVADKDGTVLIAGTVEGTFELAGTELGAKTGHAVYVARLDEEGQPLWATGFPVTDTVYLRDLALDAAGAIYLAGSFKGTFEADRTLVSELAATFDIVVLKLDAGGGVQWSAQVGGRGNDEIQGLAVDSQGRVTVVGSPGFDTPISLPSGELVPPQTNRRSVLVVHFGADGWPQWGKIFGNGGNNDVAMTVAADAHGHVVVGGQTSGLVDFGSGAQRSSGFWDLYLSQYSETGVHGWVQGGQGNSATLSLVRAVTFAGAEWVGVGMLDGATSIAGQPFEHVGHGDVIVLRVLQDGSLKWGRMFGGPAAQENPSDVGIDGKGHLYVAGTYSGAETDFGGGPLPADGSHFVMQLDAQGRHLWSDGFELSNAAMAVAADGAITLVGSFAGAIAPGGHSLVSAGQSDIYVLRL